MASKPVSTAPVEDLDPRELARAAEIAAAEGEWERYRAAMFKGASVGKHRQDQEEARDDE